MTSRRQYLLKVGTVAAALLGVGTDTALAQNAVPEGIYFTDKFPGAEYLVIENRGRTEVNLEDYHINFEYNGKVDQIRQFGTDAEVSAGSDLTFEPGERLVIATGAKDVDGADVAFNYKGSVLNDDESDTYAILAPDGESVVARSDQTPSADAPTTTAASADAVTETPGENAATDAPSGGDDNC